MTVFKSGGFNMCFHIYHLLHVNLYKENIKNFIYYLFTYIINIVIY